MNEPLMTVDICSSCGEDLEVSRELVGDRLLNSITPCPCKAKEMVEAIEDIADDCLTVTTAAKLIGIIEEKAGL